MTINSKDSHSLLQLVQIFVDEAIRLESLGKVTITEKYVNKEDENDVLINPTFDYVYSRGLDLSKYHRTTTKGNPKKFISALLSPSKITDKDVNMLKDFVAIVESLVDEKSNFKQQINVINASINKAKMKNDIEREKELRMIKAQMYIDFEVTPKATYKDILTYNALMEQAKKFDNESNKGRTPIRQTEEEQEEIEGIMNDFSGHED
jgi:hypothetical protein